MDLVSMAPVTEETQDFLQVTVPTQREQADSLNMCFLKDFLNFLF